MGMSNCAGNGYALSSSPRQWQLLSDRIEKNIEDVLNEVVPPRSQTVPPRPPERYWDDLLDSGHDLRLDVAYADFYQEQRTRNAQLPSPLEAPSLFTTLAKQLLEERSAEPHVESKQSPGVQQLINLVQELHEGRSGTPAPMHHRSASEHLQQGQHSAIIEGLATLGLGRQDNSGGHPLSRPSSRLSNRHAELPHMALPHRSATPNQSDSFLPPPPATELAPARYASPAHGYSALDMSRPSPTPPPDTLAAIEAAFAVQPGGHSHLHDLPPLPGQASVENPKYGYRGSTPSPGSGSHLYPGQYPPSPLLSSPQSHGMVHTAHSGPRTARRFSGGRGHGHSPLYSHSGGGSPPRTIVGAPQGAPPVGHQPDFPPEFQNAFNAAFYAAYMAGQPPMVVDSSGNLVPALPDGSPYTSPTALGMDGLAVPHPPGHSAAPLYGVAAPGYAAPRAGGMRGQHVSDLGRAAGVRAASDMAAHEGAAGAAGGVMGLGRADFSPPYGASRGRGVRERKPAHPVPLARRERGAIGAMGSAAAGAAGAGTGGKGFEGALMPGDPGARDLVGKMVGMAREQHGCRYLQRLLAHEDADGVALLLDEVLPHAGALMVDPFGNYLVQKVLDVADARRRRAVLGYACAEGLSSIACNTHGTRAVQKLVESIEGPEDAARFVEELKPDALRLIMDSNGNHVIQRCLQKFPAAQTQHFHAVVIANCLDVARHRHGCCVLQRCMDYAAPATKRELVLAVSEHGLELAQNAFGNYVVQYILDTGLEGACNTILEQLQGRFANLSCQKFASNVVEKALKMSSVGMEAWRAVIVQELIEAPDHGALLRDQFGNYVLQSALRVTGGEAHAALAAAIKPHMHCLKNMQHGKRILQQLQGAV